MEYSKVGVDNHDGLFYGNKIVSVFDTDKLLKELCSDLGPITVIKTENKLFHCPERGISGMKTSTDVWRIIYKQELEKALEPLMETIQDATERGFCRINNQSWKVERRRLSTDEIDELLERGDLVVK